MQWVASSPQGGSNSSNPSVGPNSSPELSSFAPDPPPPPGCQESASPGPGSSQGLDRVRTDPIEAPDSQHPHPESGPGSAGPRGSPEKGRVVVPKAGIWSFRDRPEGRKGEGPAATGRALRLPEATGGARIAGAGAAAAAAAGRARPSASRYPRHSAGAFAAQAGYSRAVGPSTRQRLSEGAGGRRRPVGPAGWAPLWQLPTARGGSVK